MAVLICGVLLWSCVHLFPSVMPRARAALIGKLGRKTYRGLFALDIVIALILIVVGWRMADIRLLYAPPLYGSPVVPALVFVSFVLFAAANAPGNIKRLLRHPMLTGVVVWSGAHLLANGDTRSAVLFGGLGAWALLSMFLINRRDGARVSPPAVPIARDAITALASSVLFGIVLYFHKTLFGVAAVPGWKQGDAMNRSDWREIAEVVGVVSIVATLLLVAGELREANRLAKTDVKLQLAESYFAVHAMRVTDADFAQLFLKIEAPDRHLITATDRSRMRALAQQLAGVYRSIQMAYEQGTLDDDDVAWYADDIARTIDGWPGLHDDLAHAYGSLAGVENAAVFAPVAALAAEKARGATDADAPKTSPEQ